MLIICNGSPKSGSTWLVQIIRSAGFAKPLPPRFQNPKWSNRSFDPVKIIDVMDEKAFTGRKIFCKQHWYGKPFYHHVARLDYVRMLNIVRDVRDMLVSRYFHDVRNGDFEGEMDDYFARGRAEKCVRDYMNYHAFWHQSDVPVFLLAFEGLKTEYEESVSRLLAHLELPKAKIPSLVPLTQTKTDITKKNTGEGKFHRKGIIGDFKNNISDAQEDLVMRWLREGDYARTKAAMARDHEWLAPILSQTDVGIG